MATPEDLLQRYQNLKNLVVAVFRLFLEQKEQDGPGGAVGISLTSVAPTLAEHNHQVQQQIRSDVHRVLRKLEEVGLIDWAPRDTSWNSDYRVLSADGVQSAENAGYLHAVLGPGYTYKRFENSVLLLQVADRSGDLHGGSCCRIAKDEILTCRHCVDGMKAPSVVIYPNQENREAKYDCEILAMCDDADLAVLRCDGLPEVEIPTIAQSSPGILEPALLMHFPNIALRMPALLATSGEVNALTQGYSKELFLTISGKVAPGSSGGGLFDRFGRLAAILTEFTVSANQTGGLAAEFGSENPFFHATPIEYYWLWRKSQPF